MTSQRRQVHHPLALERAVRQVRRHAWQTPGYSGEYAEMIRMFDDFKNRFQTHTDVHLPDPVCICTHPSSTHNMNGLCIALPGVLGCGCLGLSLERQS